MSNIVLIACASQKLGYPAKAKDLYISTLFTLSLSYAKRQQPSAIYILSAKHGLLDPETVLEPYNLTLNEMPSAQVQAWAARVVEQLGQKTNLSTDHFVFLAGARYRKYIIPDLASYAIPLEGLRIGEQLGYLSKHQ